MRTVLWELIPVRMRDVSRFLKWLTPNMYAVFRLVVNLIVVASRITTAFIRHNYNWMYVLGFSAGLYTSNTYDMGKLFLIVCGIVGIFMNLGNQGKPGELSAYSVFNKNFNSLLGQLTGDMLDRQLRHQPGENQGDDD